MNWQVKLSNKSIKALANINLPDKIKLLNFIDKLPNVENPRSYGSPLTGKLKGLWRYRVGNYRLICELKDQELVILIVMLGHRKQIYKK